MEIVDQVIS